MLFFHGAQSANETVPLPRSCAPCAVFGGAGATRGDGSATWLSIFNPPLSAFRVQTESPEQHVSVPRNISISPTHRPPLLNFRFANSWHELNGNMCAITGDALFICFRQPHALRPTNVQRQNRIDIRAQK